MRIPTKMQVEDVKTIQFSEAFHKNGMLARQLMPPQFPSHLPKVPRLPRKKCQLIPSAAPVTQNHLGEHDDLIIQSAAKSVAKTFMFGSLCESAESIAPASKTALQRPTLNAAFFIH